MGKGKEIDKNILRYLAESGKPASSREIALAIGNAWHSVNQHCLRLKLSGELEFFRIGGMNVWSVAKNE